MDEVHLSICGERWARVYRVCEACLARAFSRALMKIFKLRFKSVTPGQEAKRRREPKVVNFVTVDRVCGSSWHSLPDVWVRRGHYPLWACSTEEALWVIVKPAM